MLDARAVAQELGRKAEEGLEEWLRWLDQPVELPEWMASKAASPKAFCCPAQGEPKKKLGPPPFLVSLPPETASEILESCMPASGPTPPESRPLSPVSSSAGSSEEELPVPAGQLVPTGPAALPSRSPWLPSHVLEQLVLQQPAGPSPRKVVSVVAPGAGVGMNGNVYARLGASQQFEVRLLGRSHEPYDRYPETWPQGAPAPNLNSFGQEIIGRNLAAGSDCLVLGSRGGQVVLPLLWQAWGDEAPPALIFNGGCAMSLPAPIFWPQRVVTFVLLGGQDYFRGSLSPEEYVAATRRHVPQGNQSTAILYVHEMQHMPQPQLLELVMEVLLEALVTWKTSGLPPMEHFSRLLGALVHGGWSGRLLHTTGQSSWQDLAFAPKPLGPPSTRPEPVAH